jgi:hypothetical protein
MIRRLDGIAVVDLMRHGCVTVRGREIVVDPRENVERYGDDAVGRSTKLRLPDRLPVYAMVTPLSRRLIAVTSVVRRTTAPASWPTRPECGPCRQPANWLEHGGLEIEDLLEQHGAPQIEVEQRAQRHRVAALAGPIARIRQAVVTGSRRSLEHEVGRQVAVGLQERGHALLVPCGQLFIERTAIERLAAADQGGLEVGTFLLADPGTE